MFSRQGLRPRQNWRGVISKDLTKIGIGWDEVHRTRGNGGQEKLVDSCRQMRLRRRMNQEPGRANGLDTSSPATTAAVAASLLLSANF